MRTGALLLFREQKNGENSERIQLAVVSVLQNAPVDRDFAIAVIFANQRLQAHF